MKKNSFKIRTILVGLLATFATVSISVPAMANRKSQPASPVHTIQPTVKFLGSENNSSLFSVAFNNDAPVKFDVIIQDADGEVIFNQTFESSKFAKTFKLVNENTDANPEGLSFHIQVKPTGEQHSFEVSNETELVTEVEIVKL